MKKTRVVLCSNINEIEKLKSLASFNEDTFDLHYMTTLDLANYLLDLSGISYKETFVSNDDLCAALYQSIKEINYFKDLSFNDILALNSSINSLRRFVLKDESKEINEKLLSNPTFKAKNEAVVEVYNLMMDIMHEKDLIDEIGVIRFALEHTKTFPDIEFIIYKNSPLDFSSPSIDKALLDKAGGKVVPLSDIGEEKVNIKSYTKAFGQTNEIENILNYIYKNKISFDQCVIAATETSDYSNIIENYRDILGFPVTIGIGRSVNETNPGKIFKLIVEWEQSFYHPEYLKRIIFDESFDIDVLKEVLDVSDELFDDLNKDLEYPDYVSLESIVDTVGSLRISFDKIANAEKFVNYQKVIERQKDLRRVKELPYVHCLIDIFNEGPISFIDNFSLMKDSSDQNALLKIAKLLSYENILGVSHKDVIKTFIKQKVGRQSSEPGKLYFTSIKNASSCLRPYLFIVGLSSNYFPGSAKEDPMIIDKDYEAFGVSASEASLKSIKDNKNVFFSLLFEAYKYGIEAHLSYSYYNSETLKPQNASSVIFDTYKIENGKDKTIADLEKEFIDNPTKYVSIDEFFKFDILPSSKIGRGIAQGEQLSYPTSIDETTKKIIKKGSLKGLSASAINTYIECPYKFFLANVLKVPQPEEVDIFELIPPNDYGTLAHLLLENLEKDTSKEEFVKKVEQAIDDYFIIHQSDNVPLKKKTKKEFVDMMINAYEMEQMSAPTVLKEEDNGCYHKKTGLIIHGLPDKVVKLGNKYWIIDYKTSRKLKHDPSDPKTMLQCVTYAYVLNKRFGYDIAGFEYWYLRYKKAIKSNDDGLSMDDYYQALDEVLDEIKTSYETGIFTPNLDKCDKCYFKKACPRKKK